MHETTSTSNAHPTGEETPGRRLCLAAGAACLLLCLGGCEYIGLGGDGTTSGSSSSESEASPSEGSGDDSTASASDDDSTESESSDESEDDNSETPSQKPTEGKVAQQEEEDEQRNPFAPELNVTETEETTDQESDRTLSPLEKFSLGSLRPAAIISEVAVPKAMFIDPEGLGHVVKEGDRIGKKGGRIQEIRNQEVVVKIPGEVEEARSRKKIVELQTTELPASQQTEQKLSEQQQKALKQLLQSEEGRRALEDSYEKVAPSAAATDKEGQQQGDRRPQGDERFPGLRPPDQQ